MSVHWPPSLVQRHGRWLLLEKPNQDKSKQVDGVLPVGYHTPLYRDENPKRLLLFS